MKKIFIAVGVAFLVVSFTVFGVYSYEKNAAYETLLAYGYTKEEIEDMNLKWMDYFGFSLTDYMLKDMLVDLSLTAFKSFYDYEDAYNKCAVFIKELIDNGTLEEGDYIMFRPDSIVLHNRHGDPYSRSTKNDISCNTDIDVLESFNRLYDYLPSVNRVNIHSNDIRFCQPETHDIYDQLIYTFDGNAPDMSENAAQMFTYYEYREPLNISKNWYLISLKYEYAE